MTNEANPARAKRVVRKTPVRPDEEIQVLVRLPVAQVEALDMLAKNHKVSRSKAAQIAVADGLKFRGTPVTVDELSDQEKRIKKMIQDEIVSALKASGSAAQHIYIKREIDEMKKVMVRMAAAISNL